MATVAQLVVIAADACCAGFCVDEFCFGAAFWAGAFCGADFRTAGSGQGS